MIWYYIKTVQSQFSRITTHLFCDKGNFGLYIPFPTIKSHRFLSEIHEVGLIVPRELRLITFLFVFDATVGN